MTEESKKKIWENKTLIIAAAVVVLTVILMYFHDQKQQRAHELQRLEKRVELLEEWGRPQQSWQSPPPPGAGLVAEAEVYGKNMCRLGFETKVG